jgi:Uma2 family endonuclease
MAKILPQLEMYPIILRLYPVVKLTDDQLYDICVLNRELWIERTAQGDLAIMPPTGGGTGHRNARLITALSLWAEDDQTGVTFDSSTGFKLPNGAMRAPDAAWVRGSRLAALSQEEKERFLPLCPDFVIELRSPTDNLAALQAKMQEWTDNGALLGWLLDPLTRHVYIYRPQRQPEHLDHPLSVSGDPVLPGFVLDLHKIWEPDF